MNYESKILDNAIIIYLEETLYSKDSIFKCVYWYSDKFDIAIDTVDEKYYEIKLRPLPMASLGNGDIETYFYKLKRDFIDFNLRDIVTKETENVRDLLIAKAFSNFENEEVSTDETSPII
jgi:His-Xaa-Ser system protein HxsD